MTRLTSITHHRIRSHSPWSHPGPSLAAMDSQPLTISPMVLIKNPPQQLSLPNDPQPVRKYRVPSIDDALPLTPLSSIVPFSHGKSLFTHLAILTHVAAFPVCAPFCLSHLLTLSPDILTLPTAHSASKPTLFSSPQTRSQTRLQLEQLNSQATSAHREHALENLQTYLSPHNLTT